MRNSRLGFCLAILTAGLGAAALLYEFDSSLTKSFALGRGWGEALFLYFRYFSIQTNIGIAVLMAVTAWRLARRQPLPPTVCYSAGLVYIAVTCATYEIMLRHQWTPRGLEYVADMTIHDIVPALTLGFWILGLDASMRRDTRWQHAAWMLVYPAAYFALTILAGALGEGYPYSFLDVGKRGYPAVFVTAFIFLGMFFALGLMVTAIARASRPPTGDRSPVV